MTRRPETGVLLAVALVLLAAAAVALTSPARPSAAPSRPGTAGAPVARTALACPDLAPAPAGTAAVRVGLAPAEPGLRDGTVSRGPAGGPSHPVPLMRGSFTVPAGPPGPVLRAAGAAAPGLFAARTDTAGRRSLGVTGCPAPRAEWWFTGAGAGLDHTSTLVLTNLDPGPAVVDVSVLGPDGPVDTVAGRGVLVAPGSSKRLPLADLAPQTADLALSVHAERGRVVAAVDDSLRGSATARRGQEWLPAGDAPARTLRIAGAPVRADARTLLVANPTDREAVVDVQLSGRSGTFTPTGLDPVTVAPGALHAVDLTRALGRAVRPGDQPALRLRSTQPVVASLRSTLGADHSYAGAVTRLPGPAAAPVVRGARTVLQLTAADRPARALVTAYDAGAGGSRAPRCGSTRPRPSGGRRSRARRTSWSSPTVPGRSAAPSATPGRGPRRRR